MTEIDTNASAKIDEYYNSTEDWARPICKDLRQLIHAADSRIQEDWKWRAPVYCFKGMLCWVVPFKAHVGINFFKGSLVEDTYNLFDKTGKEGKHNRIVKITTGQQLITNNKAITKYLKKAVELNEDGIKPALFRPELIVPEFLANALSKQAKAQNFFDGLAYSHKQEYIQWLTGAKRESTRKARLEKALDMLNNDVKMHDQYRKR